MGAARPVRYTLADVRDRTYKRPDAWWTVLLVDPLAARLVVLLANRMRVTPNQLTVVSLLFGLGAAAAFAQASRAALVAGALLYHVSFTFDCVDGKIARLKGTGSIFGSWLDYVFDRLRVLACSLALMSGRYRVTDDTVYLYLAFAVVFLDMLRYMNALQTDKVGRLMTARLQAAREGAGIADAGPSVVAPARRPAPGAAGGPEHGAALPPEPRPRLDRYPGLRDALARRRIRPHLFSGVEYQMFVFIVAPLTGWILPVVAGASALLLVFELAVVSKLWRSTRGFERELASIQRRAPAGGGEQNRVRRQAHG